MKWGIISDIHGYVEPLEIVLEKLRIARVARIYCLGDITSGGRRENECIELLISHGVESVAGNHCRASRNDEKNYDGLNPCSKAYLKSDLIRVVDDYCFAHANPLRQGLLNYGLPPWEEDPGIRTEEQARKVFERTQYRVIFIGHTHMPGVWAWKEGRVEWMDLHGVIALERGTRYILNPGAVAHPKILTPHQVAHPEKEFDASYAILDTERSTFCVERVPIFRNGRPVIAIEHPESYGIAKKVWEKECRKRLRIKLDRPDKTGRRVYDRNYLKGEINYELREHVFSPLYGSSACVLLFTRHLDFLLPRFEERICQIEEQNPALDDIDRAWLDGFKKLYKGLKGYQLSPEQRSILNMSARLFHMDLSQIEELFFRNFAEVEFYKELGEQATRLINEPMSVRLTAYRDHIARKIVALAQDVLAGRISDSDPKCPACPKKEAGVTWESWEEWEMDGWFGYFANRRHWDSIPHSWKNGRPYLPTQVPKNYWELE